LSVEIRTSQILEPLSTGDNAGLRITYLGHATVLIEVDGVRILTDPLLRERTVHLRRSSFAIESALVDRIDAVMISHLHLDHFDLPSLRMLPRNVRIVVPAGAGPLVRDAGFRDVREVSPGSRFSVCGVEVDVTLANHDGFRPPFGPRAGCVGYIVHGSESVYFAGDTDLFSGMRDFSDSVDVALLPIWGWGPTLGNGHLDPLRAAHALTLLQPRVAIPIHWGTLCPIGLHWTRPGFLSDPPYEFLQRARRIAPDVDVRVVIPGRHADIVRPPL
jgi:L-ascorbate metabolism protein UlaG (beta-lactamase superfamily)